MYVCMHARMLRPQNLTPTSSWCYTLNLLCNIHSFDASLLACPWNFESVFDATLFSLPEAVCHALDATLFALCFLLGVPKRSGCYPPGLLLAHSPGTCQQALHGTLLAFCWKESGHIRIATRTLDATLSTVSWNTSTRSVCWFQHSQDATMAAPARSSCYARGFRLEARSWCHALNSNTILCCALSFVCEHSGQLLMLRSQLSPSLSTLSLSLSLSSLDASLLACSWNLKTLSVLRA